MEPVSSRKCSYFNIGYCKYRDKGCKHVHPEEKCALSKCTDNGCPKRHQQYCRLKASCKFNNNQSCEFLHKDKNHIVGQNTSDEMVTQLNMLVDIIATYYIAFKHAGDF